MNDKRLRRYRGSDIAMIFQDPMTSLNPTMTCGKQITESLILQETYKKAGLGGSNRNAQAGGYSRSGKAHERLPPRAFPAACVNG